MDLELAHLVIGLVSMVGGAGGAWTAQHARHSGLVKRIDALDSDLEKHDDRTRGVGERLAKIETLLETIDKRLERMEQ